MDNFLSIVQRAFEATPVRGKGRVAGLLLKGRTDEVTCHPVPGLTIVLDPRQRIERLMWAGAYELGLVKQLKSFLKPGMFFLDLGANIGYFSGIAAALVGPAGRVFAFEPSPACHPRLERNLSAFEQSFIYKYAASDKNGQAAFYLHPWENGWGSLLAGQDARERVQVDTVRLDDWAQQARIERLDFVKIDIEGGECAALLGAQSLLRCFRPVVVAELNSVCLSRNQRTPEDVVGLLLDAGYRCERSDDTVLATPST
jgi:FkbM family methyltransferase